MARGQVVRVHPPLPLLPWVLEAPAALHALLPAAPLPFLTLWDTVVAGLVQIVLTSAGQVAPGLIPQAPHVLKPSCSGALALGSVSLIFSSGLRANRALWNSLPYLQPEDT